MQVALLLYLIFGILPWGGQARPPMRASERSAALKTSVCEILKAPESFDGKVVTTQARVLMGFESLTLVESGCSGSIWLAYPDEIGHPPDSQRIRVKLIRDAEFDAFQKAIGAEAEDTPQNPCRGMHCMRYDVRAEIIGRVDYRPTSCKNQSSTSNAQVFKCGYGHMGAWDVRFVLEKVSNVVATLRPQ